MKELNFIFYFLLFFCFSCSLNNKTIVIKNVSLFDGEQYIHEANIVIENNFIKGVYKNYKPNRGEKIINGSGKTIIPPLINAHVHVWESAQLKSAQKAGVFSLLDMYNSDENANKMRSYRDSSDYAYFYSSGYGATSPGGHGTQFGLPSPTIHEFMPPEQFVTDRVNNGADYIKVIREPTRNTLSYFQIEKTINAAHKNDLLAVAHISNLKDAMKLSAQKVDGLVHLWFDSPISDEQLDSLKESGIFIIPTLLVTTHLLNIYEKEHIDKKHLPRKELLKEIKKVFDAGIPLLAGTDAPNFDINFGADIVKELHLLSEAGIPNLDVLKAATSNVYSSFQLKEFGKLKEGSLANFILVNGDPLKNINDLNKIESVWKNGEILNSPIQ